MPKKIKEIEDVEDNFEEGLDLAPILPITRNFDREDLNLLRDKINEIISRS